MIGIVTTQFKGNHIQHNNDVRTTDLSETVVIDLVKTLQDAIPNAKDTDTIRNNPEETIMHSSVCMYTLERLWYVVVWR